MIFGPNIFVRLANPIQAGRAIMKRREPQDKEFFVQDWIEKPLVGPTPLRSKGETPILTT